MTDLAHYTGGPNVPALDNDGSALIMRTVQQMQGAHQLAKALANTAFVPYQWRGKPDDVAAAILYGAAIGLDPMSALRGLYVVNGNPGMYARQMAALVMSKGHTLRTVEVTDTSATVSGQRRGSDHVETVTWTIERAKQAGYVPTIDPKTGKYRTNDKTGKVIGNEKYLTDPQSMLYARALGDVCRRIAPDALAGLDYTVEELQVISAEAEIVRDRPKRESAASLLAGSAPEDTTSSSEAANEPAAVEPAPDSESATEGAAPSPPITQAQQKKMGALMRQAGITERSAALAYVRDIIGHAVNSRAELTKQEAGAVIDALEAAAGQQAGKADPPGVVAGEVVDNDAYEEWAREQEAAGDNQLLPDDPDLQAGA
ncbi:hypothetical protein ABZ215_13810 [Amycolatopsis sp. NPDC006131]|uniref:hypothetical protein n=1 Tax=Amycolatopsis sp. NPDC006131 TaxID=3156731 RepID=UPI0033A4BBA6